MIPSIKLTETTLTPNNKVYIQQYIQTGDKKEDIKINVPRMKQLLTEIFSNDLSEFNICTSISEKTLKRLVDGESLPKIHHTDSLIDIPYSYIGNPLLLIDDKAEVQPYNLKKNMYLVTFQIPYKLDWDEANLKYHPNVLLPNQLSYHETVCNVHES